LQYLQYSLPLSNRRILKEDQSCVGVVAFFIVSLVTFSSNPGGHLENIVILPQSSVDWKTQVVDMTLYWYVGDSRNRAITHAVRF